MSAFDIQAAKSAFLDLIRTIPGQQDVVDGAPESFQAGVTAWVVIGDLEMTPQFSGGVYQLRLHLIVTFGYAVAGREDTAEDDLAAAIGEFLTRVVRNRLGDVTGNTLTVTHYLNGTVKRMDLPIIVAMPSDYLMFAGQEVRAYPLGLPIYFEANISG